VGRTSGIPLLIITALALVSGGCGGKERASSTPSAVATFSGPITVTITSPEEGANVTNPFALSVQSTGVRIAAASEQVPGAAHYHAFLDATPVAEGEVIPSGSGIFHFTNPLTDMRVVSGEHTIIVVLGNNDHVRLRGAPTAEVHFSQGPTPGPSATSTAPATTTPAPTDSDSQ
jgi:hypothetical protein